MAEKWHAPAVPADAEKVLSKVPTTKPANPGRVAAGKKSYLNEIVYDVRQKRTKNCQKPLRRKKRSQRTQAAESTVICFLELEVELSPLWVFIISERRL